MPEVFPQDGAGHPNNSSNRTREDASSELAEYVGGTDNAEVRVRAGKAWDAAVREFNTVGWRFNRRQQSITLVVDTKEYSLETDFRSPIKCVLQDSSSNNQYPLIWLPHEIWLEYFPGQTYGASCADFYTVLNAHNLGLVRFDPWPAGTLNYPTANITYLCRIALATASSDKLNVPMEVDEAIFQLAATRLIERTRGGDAPESMVITSTRLRLECEREHREWPEMTGWGANG